MNLELYVMKKAIDFLVGALFVHPNIKMTLNRSMRMKLF